MANEDHLRILRQGVDTWNKWRKEESDVKVDLTKANLSMANLSKANLIRADLYGADLRLADLREAKLNGANLSVTNLYKADLSRAELIRSTLIGAYLRESDLINANLMDASLFGANLSDSILFRAILQCADLGSAILSSADFRYAGLQEANLIGSDLSEANFHGASLKGADLSNADLSGADLSKSDLTKSVLIETNLEGANITDCRTYGISIWRVKLSDSTIQKGIIITSENEPTITVDNLEVAQFIYLLLHNDKIHHVIDTITSKVVLILGRFTPERKVVLDALREELRKRNYPPIVFDFDKPASRDLTETISMLARMAKFIIADITDAKSIPAELSEIVKDLPSVPLKPLILDSDFQYALFEHIQRYPWVLDTYRYENQEKLIASIAEKVIAPAEKKVSECRPKPF